MKYVLSRPLSALTKAAVPRRGSPRFPRKSSTYSHIHLQPQATWPTISVISWYYQPVDELQNMKSERMCRTEVLNIISMTGWYLSHMDTHVYIIVHCTSLLEVYHKWRIFSRLFIFIAAHFHFHLLSIFQLEHTSTDNGFWL